MNAALAAGPLASDPAAKEEEQPAPVEAPTRTGEGKGYAGTIKAVLMVDETGAITALSLDGTGDTLGIGNQIDGKAFKDQFIGKTGPFEIGNGVDAVAGATMSSKGAVEAVNAALGF